MRGRPTRLLAVPAMSAILIISTLGPTNATTRLVSVGLGAVQGNNDSSSPSISADGRYIVFTSSANNLTPGDTNLSTDIYRVDLTGGLAQPSVTLVSVNPTGFSGNGSSRYADISADGRYVAFASDASDLVTADTNARSDVFVRDLVSGTTTRVSVTASGLQADSHSEQPSISRDGRYVAFRSLANNLVPGDTNGQWDVFVKDRSTGTISRASVANDGSQASGWGSFWAQISGDGNSVLFSTLASNIVASDTNNTDDTFVRDLVAGTTQRVSVDSSGGQIADGGMGGGMSADGRYVTFWSKGAVVPGVPAHAYNFQVYRIDRTTGSVVLASAATDGTAGNRSSSHGMEGGHGEVSDDGRYVVFQSNATNLVASPPSQTGAYVRDTVEERTTLVSAADDGTPANNQSEDVAISGNAAVIAFASTATNLVAPDANFAKDVFIWGDVDAPECLTPNGGASTTVPYYCETRYDDANELGDNIGEIGDQLATAYGDRYAGTWIDRTVAPSALRIGVVNPTTQDWQTLYAISGLPTNRAGLVSQQYSSATLTGYRATVEGILASKSYDYLEGISDPDNLIDIHTAGADALLAGQITAAGVPANAFRINTTFSGGPTHTSRDQWTGQYEAGLKLRRNQTGTVFCTTGYMGYDNSTPRKYYATTAGHCAYPAPKQVWIDFLAFTIDRTKWVNGATVNSDSARHYVTASTSQISYRIYTGGNNGHRDIIAYYQASQMYLGTRLCFQGVTSHNNNCGNINASNARVKATNIDGTSVTIAHVWCMNYPAQGGDSGGPVYHVNADLKTATAAGEVEGGYVVAGVVSMCFSGATYIMSDMGLTLYRKV